MLACLKSYGQTNIQLIMKSGGTHKIEKVEVFDLSQKEFHTLFYKDTVNFVFDKPNIDCYNIRYHSNGKMYRQQVWLNSGLIKIEVHIADSALIIDSVFNSPIYYEHLTLSKNYSQLYLKKDTAAITDILLELYKKNIDNPYSFVLGNLFIGLNQNSKKDLLKLKTLTDQQGNKFNWFFLYPAVQERLQNILSQTSLNLNEYAFINLENKKVKLPAFTNNKYYILDFWFLACAPCVRDHKEIFRHQQTLTDKKAELISISTDDSIKDLNNYLIEHKYKWANYLQSNPKKVTNDLNINIFPTYLILDKFGNILCSQNAFSDVLKWLKNNN